MESNTIRDAEDVLKRISEPRTMAPITPEQAHDMYMSFMAGMNWSLMDWYFKGIRDAETHHKIANHDF